MPVERSQMRDDLRADLAGGTREIVARLGAHLLF